MPIPRPVLTSFSQDNTMPSMHMTLIIQQRSSFDSFLIDTPIVPREAPLSPIVIQCKKAISLGWLLKKPHSLTYFIGI